MAAELAKCLTGPLVRKDGYIETSDGVVTWVFGHILRQAEPGEYDKKYERWRAEDLPIIPETWKLLVADSCRKQFAIIKDQINTASEIVHAGDPDREGQLLVDEVLDYIQNSKIVRRILLNALDERSIKKSLADLRDNKDFYNLKQSALARSRADWLIGMNLSRAYTLAAQRAGHRVTLPVGRVKTPTLALVVRREREIAAFQPVDYFTVKADFAPESAISDSSFTAYWKPKDEQAGLDTEGRLIDAAVAETLMRKLSNEPEKARIVLCETRERQEPQRLPLSLSALQVLAGKEFGYEPQLVLDTAQALYEKKLTTYPRSDCDYLPESQHADAIAILENLRGSGQENMAAWSAKADPALKSRAWNDKKITAHHAIIPTTEQCKFATLKNAEKDIYFLIAQAYIAQFYPVHIYKQTRIEIEHAGEAFTASGRMVTQAGWKEIYGAESEEKEEGDNGTLPAMRQGDLAAFLSLSTEKKATKPPVRFTAATLLAAMKAIHKYVKNPDLKKQLKDVSGIGTEATRATIINELIERGFMTQEKKQKYLIPTNEAYLLIDALPDEITYPDCTAVWEDILHQMTNGAESLEVFLEQQARFAAELCEKAYQIQLPQGEGHACPQCGQGVLKLRNGKNGQFWGCTQYPNCKATYEDENGKPQPAPYPCPQCGRGALKLRNGARGKFWGCSRYPACRAGYDDADGKPLIR